MKNKLSEFAVKAGKTILVIISKQLISYVSSEEFTRKVKQLIQYVVSNLVSVVLEEKNATNKKSTGL
ncbi:hypothetical protein [Carnobacterium sp. PL17GRE32]|uniref:hypothetical protein n=1 Tax=Carnobacterium sp. PL17GRE32 TaxID=2592355 RepID=UPI000EDFA9B5|nr:hypothetical protein [Carnobacterium sp. PL17GRE32]KAF3306180.1 hypothetical protein FPV25_02280 [Carnobacterium sp. PL17GRE32]HCT98085.1 hypothetical protein [Aerococcus urinaeequi]